MMKCENCKYFFYDSSVGISECGQYDNMTEEETDKYYVRGKQTVLIGRKMINNDQ